MQSAEIEPNCQYIRSDKYNEVTTLQIIHEACKQETYKPNIKHLENGENEYNIGYCDINNNSSNIKLSDHMTKAEIDQHLRDNYELTQTTIFNRWWYV